ncbi:TetR/AcrR family transcriptional regulator [Nocardia sp. NPDC050406]|uniref:TetR/AcrR family transcriptional regulator n=1 Tax=Nocardia sp. NPDC050406 TaxID=3364318 RepID=UPI00379DA24C
MPTTTRLTRQARREQLLDTALGMVRTQGTDNLSLVSLAEAAGVSRPIVYDHFGTRSGLLLALYRQLADQLREASTRALDDVSPEPRALARAVSAAYFGCVSEIPEWTAVSAALKGDPELDEIELELCDSYAEVMLTAFGPYSTLPTEALRLRCFGVMGAAETIAAELIRGRASLAEATEALTGLIVAGIDLAIDDA